MNFVDAQIKPKPFLRWAGGKTWLLPKLNEIVPQSFNDYHEPFLGGAAVFFSLSPSGNCNLADTNGELINAYKVVKNSVNLLIEKLNEFKNTETFYYKARESKATDNLTRAARFIYLNRTCFNGIYRVNKEGIFNVPYGHIKRSQFINEDVLRMASARLKKARLTVSDFEESLSSVKKGDLVFIDPPYTVAHNNNGFIEYNQKIFSWSDQERLAACVSKLESRGAFFIVTNAYHKSIKALYEGIGTKIEVERPSTISGHMHHRKIISEYIITNCITK